MYLEKIAMENLGPLKKININLPFNGNGNPKPIIFVGENGSGKSILLSSIVDALYELENKIFEDILPKNGLGYKYYKMVSSSYRQPYTAYSYAALIFKENDERYEYLDKTGILPDGCLLKELPGFRLMPTSVDDTQKISTEVKRNKQEKLKQEFIASAYQYLPAYRYEEPFWKNDVFRRKESINEDVKYQNQLKKNIEILSSIGDNKAYILDILLDYFVSKNGLDGKKLEQINQILRSVKKDVNLHFGIGKRGQNRIAIIRKQQDRIEAVLPSIDNLSLGELILFNLFLNILRYCDNSNRDLNEMTGIVVVDEVDIHLHGDLQKDILPDLIRLFPKVQFIITTHAPLFLLGMEKKFGSDGIEIRELPSGDRIIAERFSEFEKAYNIFTETKTYEEKLSAVLSGGHKPIAYFEGDIDIDYVKKAAERLGKQSILDQIELKPAGGKMNLDHIHKLLNIKEIDLIKNKVLLVYDCDVKKSLNDEVNRQIIRKIIPVIHANPIKAGIENLFSPALIATAKTTNSKFIDHTPSYKKMVRGKEIAIDESFEVNRDEKRNLCTWICQNGSTDDFAGFECIFEFIEEGLLR